MRIDGCFNHALSTRDLPSKMHLLALPALSQDAATAVAAIEALFIQHGPPLVYKSDNGSAFISADFVELLRRWQVTALLSPPCTPRYNGSAEAGIGSLKTRIFYQAIRHGAYDWTSDDVEAARQQANCAVRPYGGGLLATPQQQWAARPRITPAQREQFRQCVLENCRQYLGEQGLEDEPWHYLSASVRALAARTAIRRALVALGYLLVTRRRITPPFKSPLRVKIR